MAKSKPILFVSHIHEDAQIAICVKRFLDEAFLGMFNVFVSGDGASIRAGENWSSSIEDALSRAELVLALISEQARDRKWIYFECGGAYFAGKRVIPICCRRSRIADLSTPLSWLQAIDGADIDSVQRLVQDIAAVFDVHAPRSDVSSLVRYLDGIPCDVPIKDNRAERVLSQRALPIFLVVDTSGSMHGEPIERLSDAIRNLMGELLQLTGGAVVPLMSLVTFGDDAQEVIPLSPLSPQSMQFALSSTGASALGAALHLLAARLVDSSLLPQRYLTPMILIFTDGSPTDDWHGGLAALNNTQLGKAANKICVGLGSSPDFGVLKRIAGESVVSLPDTASVRGLSRFFMWVSSSVRMSAETNQERVQLPDPNEWLPPEV